MNRKLNKKEKIIILTASMVLILVIAIGGIIALLMDDGGSVNNLFQSSKVTTEIEESFDGTTKSNVKVKNTGDIDAYIRAEVIVTWQNANGDVYSEKPVPVSVDNPEGDYTISIDNQNWFKKDGYYYHKNIVAKSAMTEILITSCQPVAGKAPEGYSLTVEIIGSGIQAKGESLTEETAGNKDDIGKPPVELAWGVTVKDGKLTQ